ncbi:MAG: class I SAM-dependent methyltransferase [Deltaproteobacteria bacterium]|nr:class I SAM-dependent methyltransferase [Deltaproteobacteria bacterium]
MEDHRAFEIFMAIHTGNPREAPGSTTTTKRAFELCQGLPTLPRVLDIGCGPGTQTLELAELCAGTFVAVDLHQPYLDRLNDEARRRGVDDRIATRRMDMRQLDFAPDSFDLIWSEGAIYNIGFRAGLEAWRPLLVQGGCMAVSEATWLTDDPPADARAFWDAGYPAMQGIDGNLRVIGETGFTSLGHFGLPASCWLDYYAHLESRMTALESELAGDTEALAVMDAERREIELYREFGDAYGYVFYVMRKAG